MKSNALNFSGGPGALPPCVLDQTQQAIVALPDTGLSVLGMSHRSEWFIGVLDEAERNIRELLALPSQYTVSFLQGGSSLLFATIAMNLAPRGFEPPEYVNSGYWSSRATDRASGSDPFDPSREPETIERLQHSVLQHASPSCR